MATTKKTPAKAPARKPAKPKYDRKVQAGRSVVHAPPTPDEAHQLIYNRPLNKPVKTLGRQIEIHDRVILHVANPIAGRNEVPAYIVAFDRKTGLPTVRVEALTPGLAMKARDFLKVPQNVAAEMHGAFWTWPDGAGVSS